MGPAAWGAMIQDWGSGHASEFKLSFRDDLDKGAQAVWLNCSSALITRSALRNQKFAVLNCIGFSMDRSLRAGNEPE